MFSLFAVQFNDSWQGYVKNHKDRDEYKNSHNHLPRSSEKFIPSDIFPPTTENNSAPVWPPSALLQRFRKWQIM